VQPKAKVLTPGEGRRGLRFEKEREEQDEVAEEGQKHHLATNIGTNLGPSTGSRLFLFPNDSETASETKWRKRKSGKEEFFLIMKSRQFAEENKKPRVKRRSSKKGDFQAS